MIGRILFFILMPIIFEGIMFLYNRKCQRWEEENIKAQILLFSSLLGIDFLIEAFYINLVKDILGVSMLSNEYDTIENYGAFGLFVFCAIIYIIGACVICPFFEDSETIPIMHTIILVFFFVILCLLENSNLHDNVDKKIFNEMEYQIEESTINLKSMSDGHTTTGSIEGHSTLGTGYIQGQIADNYNIYYCFVASNGETVIDSLVYTNESVNIWEEGETCNPRIVTHKYYKYYKTDYNEFYNEYYVYDIYIPSISGGVNVNME